MKRKLLPLAIGAAIAMPSVALAGPTVYGKVNVSFENNDIDDGSDSSDQWELDSNASRLGVKGSEKISDSLSAIYKLEYEVAVDDGDDVFKQRNIFGGLKGGFGAVQAGNFDTPTKTAQKKIDMFNDLSGDIKNYLVGENRSSNLVQYTTPKMGGLVAKLAVQPGEERGDDDARDGVADGFSGSVAFDQDGLYLALAADQEIQSKVVIGDDSEKYLMDGYRLVAQYNMDAITVGFLYQDFETSEDGVDFGGATVDSVEQDGFVLSGSFKAGDNKFKAQFGQSTTEVTAAGTAEVEADQIALGVDHKLSKQTKLFAYYNAISYELDGTSAEYEDTTLGFGMEHKF